MSERELCVTSSDITLVERTALLDDLPTTLTQDKPAEPALTTWRHICEAPIDTHRYGQEIGTSFQSPTISKSTFPTLPATLTMCQWSMLMKATIVVRSKRLMCCVPLPC